MTISQIYIGNTQVASAYKGDILWWYIKSAQSNNTWDFTKENNIDWQDLYDKDYTWNRIKNNGITI